MWIPKIMNRRSDFNFKKCKNVFVKTNSLVFFCKLESYLFAKWLVFTQGTTIGWWEHSILKTPIYRNTLLKEQFFSSSNLFKFFWKDTKSENKPNRQFNLCVDILPKPLLVHSAIWCLISTVILIDRAVFWGNY